MVSNIGTGYKEGFPYQWPYTNTSPPPPISPFIPLQPIPTVGTEEFESLRKEVLELKDLLLAAKKFDAATGQPDCDMEDKVDLLKKLGKYLGVDLSEVFAK